MIEAKVKRIRVWLISCAICCAFVPSVRGVEAAELKILHSFGGGNDGAHPDANVVDVNGNIYGTTGGGGAYSGGTAFELATDGTETVLHSFGQYASNDGADPGGLIANNRGILYGTTQGGGGVERYGTIFMLKPDGTETVLYAFNEDGADGAYPVGGVIKDRDGNLYGTTYEGGYNEDISCSSDGCGTVFKLAPDGTETVLYAFKGWDQNDGELPYGGLIRDKAGNLYGTTGEGGGNGLTWPGTVFRLAPDGTEILLHSFNGGADGANPRAGLIEDDAGNLYGTTYDGGNSGCYGNLGCGTVFKVAPDGTETVLHAFASGNDGAHPEARLLIDKTGDLYGTTAYGGRGNCRRGDGCGTIFKLSPNGTETVLYACQPRNCDRPEAGLIEDKAGNLYGTASAGGVYKSGVVFRLKQ